MARKATTLRELAQIRADRRELLNDLAGSQGTALGRKNFGPNDRPVGEPCIIVYIPHKIHDALLDANLRIPSTLTSKDGTLEAPTDVVVTTLPNISKQPLPLSNKNLQLIDYLQWRDGNLDHLPSGAQVGAAQITGEELGTFVGTLGFPAKSRTNSDLIGFITNQHVGVHAGHSLYVPGYGQQSVRLGITREVSEYKPDDQWIAGIDEEFAFVRTDAAFVVVEQQLRSLLRPEVPGAGVNGEAVQMGAVHPTDLDSMDLIGMPVKKVGRTTGVQKGTIVAFGYGIQSEEEFIDRRVGKEPANFYTDFLIAPRGDSEIFSAPGDSGSAILLDTPGEDTDNRPIALLWGGRPTDIGRQRGLEDLTYGISINRILDILDVDILSQPE